VVQVEEETEEYDQRGDEEQVPVTGNEQQVVGKRVEPGEEVIRMISEDPPVG